MLVDGRAVRSCTLYAVQVDGCEITTVEGVNAGRDGLTDLQMAFRRHHALQCGFCTAGILMSATHSSRKTTIRPSTKYATCFPDIFAAAPAIAGIVDAILETARRRAPNNPSNHVT